MAVQRRLTIPESSRISLIKYPMKATLMRRDDSPIAEWEMNLNYFVKIAAKNPQADPIKIEHELR